MKYKLTSLLKLLKEYEILKGKSLNVTITGINDSSKDIKKSEAFICIKGIKFDGHNYVNESFRKGVRVFIVEKEIKLKSKDVVIIKVKDTKDILLKLNNFLFKDILKKIKIIGITGTNGKTTISYIIDKILNTHYKKENAVIGTIGYKIGKKILYAKTTTPSNTEINKLIEKAVKQNIKYFIIEVSSHALDQGRISNIKFDTAIITNITRDHLDYHKSFKNYLKAKLKIINNLKKSGKLVLNIDDENIKKYALLEAKKQKRKIITCSKDKNSTIKVKNFSMSTEGIKMSILIKNKKIDLQSSLIGEHNIYNILLAIGATFTEVTFNSLKKAIKNFETVKGRLEKIYDENFTVFIDFAHTPDSMEKVLTALNKIKKGNIITVFGAGGNRDKGKRPLMGKIAYKFSDKMIITSDNPRFENPLKIINDILKGIPYKNKNKVYIIPDRKKAIIKSIEMAQKNDIVIIMGKGHETYQEIKGKRIPFDDKKIALSIIKGNKNRLEYLLNFLDDYKIIYGDINKKITGIEDNSKNVKKGNVFICVKGFNTDGHNYIQEAIKNGASVIIVEKDINTHYKNTTIIKVNNTKEVLYKLTNIYYKEFRNKINIIGVTGTDGKTTVTYLVDYILKHYNKRENAVIGTIKYRIGKKEYEAINTTPPNVFIHKLMKLAVKENIENFITEVSSHALSQERIKNIYFDTAVITNITRDHLDYHKNFSNYFKTKLSILNHIKKNGMVIVNQDDKHFKKILKEIKLRKIKYKTFSLKTKNADIYVNKYSFSLNGTRAEININNKTIKIFTPLLGEHNLYNILAAICVVSERINLKYIPYILKNFTGIPSRLERIYNDDFSVFLDFAHTPEAIKNVLSVLRKITKNELICVFGLSGNRDRGKRKIMGEIVEQLSDKVILTTDNPRYENPDNIFKDILKGVKNKNEVLIEKNRKLAIKTGIMNAKKGDVVLVIGKGHQPYQEVKGKKIPFDDKKVILKIIREKVRV